MALNLGIWDPTVQGHKPQGHQLKVVDTGFRVTTRDTGNHTRAPICWLVERMWLLGHHDFDNLAHVSIIL